MLDEKDGTITSISSSSSSEESPNGSPGIEEMAAELEEDDVLAAEEDDDDDVTGFNGVAGTSIPATGLPMISFFVPQL